MTRSLWFVIIMASLFLSGASSPVFSQDSQEACGTPREEWGTAYQALKQRMEEVRRLKIAPLESAIQRELADPRNSQSMARSVRAALKERSALTDSVRQECREVAERERMTFERLRTCLAPGRQRRATTNDSVLSSDMSERKLVLTTLQDLLLDDAYLQYKNYRAPSPPSYSGYAPQWGTGPGSASDLYRANSRYR